MGLDGQEVVETSEGYLLNWIGDWQHRRGKFVNSYVRSEGLLSHNRTIKSISSSAHKIGTSYFGL